MEERHLRENDRTCDKDGCGNPTSWDMAALIIDSQWFCSPSCAGDGVEVMEGSPETVALHDPQFAVSREEFVDVEGTAVNIERPVENAADAKQAIEKIESLYPTPFR